jgi:hypothetical protein
MQELQQYAAETAACLNPISGIAAVFQFSVPQKKKGNRQ